MRIVILTQYYPPETGAPQNRLHALTKSFGELGNEVTVLTAMPNYPQMSIFERYSKKLYVKEKEGNVIIHRSAIFVTRSKSVPLRLLNYFSFVITSLVIGLVKLKKHDVLICESPPLFLGISAYLLSRIKRSKLIMNISDLWPESAERLGLVSNQFLLKLSTRLELFLYKKSILISGQTKGIVSNISSRLKNKPVYWLPNGADSALLEDSKIESNWRSENGYRSDQFLLLYAGIIGHAQGLEVILKAASLLKKNSKIRFIIIGSGPELPMLIELKKSLMLENVTFFNPVSKAEMNPILSSIDAGVVPLKKLELFKGAIPSKIFELLAFSKPVFLGVDGEAKQLFVEEGKCAIYFDPENYTDLANKVQQFEEQRDRVIELGSNGRTYVAEYFHRDTIARQFNIFIHGRLEAETKK
ncbi:MAG TPA: glycosyltransferase family 4 protein [Bacteroidia bacterium]|nr:glycosyltransferase family 4 protein [Bacteroidia bacterium]HNT79215.1 glycosyltransferase family 4 protein [Bacteroidia bacterium]